MVLCLLFTGDGCYDSLVHIVCGNAAANRHYDGAERFSVGRAQPVRDHRRKHPLLDSPSPVGKEAKSRLRPWVEEMESLLFLHPGIFTALFWPRRRWW